MKKLLIFLMVLTCLIPAASAYETREELRAAYQALGIFPGETPYEEEPVIEAPYAAGKLQEAAMEEALEYLNFLRGIAGLGPVTRSRIYDYQCQHGAVLMAALDCVDHNAPQPEDMDRNFYDSAHLATTSSNIAKFYWMSPTMLREGVSYFARDDGPHNLSVLGHRRWLLNPAMSATGFGLANSKTGMSYMAMYAHDRGRTDVQWSEICWPTGGIFPVELMRRELPWSVSLNPEIYDVNASGIRAVLEEETLGLRFEFDCSAGEGDGFCTVSTANYGGGPCVIFMPDFEETGFVEYQQNQRWTVKLTGLVRTDGTDAELGFEVDMASLYVQEVANIEISLLEAEMQKGETLKLSAAVIPEYADDLAVSWSSGDPAVADVDQNGTVTAVAPGVCEITVQSANGRSDVCRVTVTE